jgi:7,8-dihydro-6-hydroxymethylpterin-pyrophosphokinase
LGRVRQRGGQSKGTSDGDGDKQHALPNHALVAERNAPRPIDIDVLLFGQQCIGTATLVVPHPRMHLRRFVLEPLMQLNPSLHIPGHGPIAPLWQNTCNQRLQAL